MSAAAALLAASLVATPPSGRPPAWPLERVEPRLYDFTFDVSLTSPVWTYEAWRLRPYELSSTPIVMPVIFRGTYSTIDPDTLSARMWFDGREDRGINQRSRVDGGFPFQAHLAVMPITTFRGRALRWSLSYRVEAWSSRLHSEQAAAEVPWPREWPAEVLDGLRPQMYIESDDPIFARAVEDASGGRLRLVPPYLAAKDLIRYCVNRIRVSGNGVNRGLAGMLHGLKMVGAKQAAERGLGGPHDLVCVCVAVLRAAGIPARPVIGVQEKTEQQIEKQKYGPEFVSWAEFYLPDVGWIPFDPLVMRGKGIRNRNVRRPWPALGTLDELNRRVPLSYHFMPPATVQVPQNPAVWGWDPRPGGAPPTEQQIRFTMTSRGRRE